MASSAEVIYTSMGMPLYGWMTPSFGPRVFRAYNDWASSIGSHIQTTPAAGAGHVGDIQAGVQELQRIARRDARGDDLGFSA